MARFYQTAERKYLDDGIYKPPTELAMQVIAARDKAKDAFDEAAMQINSLSPDYNDKLDYDSAVAWVDRNQAATDSITNQFLQGDEMGAMKALRQYQADLRRDYAVGALHTMSENKKKAEIHEKMTANVEPYMKEYFDRKFYNQANGNAALSETPVENVNVYTDPLVRVKAQILEYTAKAKGVFRSGNGKTKDGLSLAEWAKKSLTPAELERYAKQYLNTLPETDQGLYNQLKETSIDLFHNDLFKQDENGNFYMDSVQDNKGNYQSKTYQELVQLPHIYKIDEYTYKTQPLTNSGAGGGSAFSNPYSTEVNRRYYNPLSTVSPTFNQKRNGLMEQLKTTGNKLKRSTFMMTKDGTFEVYIGDNPNPYTITREAYDKIVGWGNAGIAAGREGSRNTFHKENGKYVVSKAASKNLKDGSKVDPELANAIIEQLNNGVSFNDFLNGINEQIVDHLISPLSTDIKTQKDLEEESQRNAFDPLKPTQEDFMAAWAIDDVSSWVKNNTQQRPCTNDEAALLRKAVMNYYQEDPSESYAEPVFISERVKDNEGHTVEKQYYYFQPRVSGKKPIILPEEKVL